MTYRELYAEGIRQLEQAGVADAGPDARLLAEFACGRDWGALLAHGDDPAGPEEQEKFFRLLRERCRRIPLQHLTGSQCFMGLDFLVTPDVLIPRQDTEILVEEVLRHLHDGMRVLDLCTGSGCIIISLLRYTNACSGLGTDISKEALAVARENVGRILDGGDGAVWQEGGVRFIESDLFERVEGAFDVIVSNPPYIPTGVIETLMPEVREHEPRKALDGGGDGLLFYRRIVSECRQFLAGGGMLFFEIGYDQGQAVSSLMEEAGFLEVQVVKDYGGLDRVVYGTLGFGLGRNGRKEEIYV